MKKHGITVFELIVYIIFGLLGLWGLTYICLGFACNFIKSDTGLAQANAHLIATTNGMGFLEEGILILSIAIIVLVITLLVTAKNSDRDFEKNQRRAARMAERHAGNVVDANTSEVSK